MNEENKTIHDFDFDLICEYFSLVDRQGPGSVETTLKALSFVDNLPQDAKIADIGCGSGGQTITLAQHISGHITAIDLFPNFINILNQHIKELKLEDKISTLVGSMDDLPFREEEFDLLWAEGSIYNIGFERGLNEWRKYLKKDGYIAVSEGTWFTNKRPEEIEKFWMDNYSEIDTISTKISQMENAGYKPMACFIIPESDWLEEFYAPMVIPRETFLQKYHDNKTAHELVKSQVHEEKLYNRYKEYYGYAFYIGKKI